jgi:hypothetical protein
VIFASLSKYVIGLLALLLALAIGYGIWQRGSKAEALRDRDSAVVARQDAEWNLSAARNTLTQERAYSAQLQKIAAEYEEGKDEIERQAAADIAALRAGNLRLHERWQASVATGELSSTAASAGQPDDRSDDRYQSAVRAVQYAAQCRAQVKGLQAVVLADRGLETEK